MNSRSQLFFAKIIIILVQVTPKSVTIRIQEMLTLANSFSRNNTNGYITFIEK